MDDRIIYYAMKIEFPEGTDVINAETELNNHLSYNGYHFYLSNQSIFEETTILLVWEEETEYVETILEDRDIKYEYLREMED